MNLEKMIDGIEKRASEEIKVEQGDYYNEPDGLLMCGKCNTPKQTRVFIFGKERTPFCLCKCEAERREREEEARRRKARLERIERMRITGFPDSDMKNWTFAHDDRMNERISQIAHNYVENFEKMRERGKGLLFYGNVGTGKTFISACIANALIDREYPCLVTNFARIVNTLSGMYEGKQNYIDSLNKFDLLVIDDLASERDTEYMGEIVQNIIDSRCRAGLPLIVTTNLTAQELKAPAEIRRQRIFSRLFEMTVPVEVVGNDRRREHLKADFAEYKNLLGL